MRALLLLIVLAGCAASAPKPDALPDFSPTVQDVTEHYIGEAMKASAIIDRLKRERDDAIGRGLSCEQGRST